MTIVKGTGPCNVPRQQRQDDKESRGAHKKTLSHRRHSHGVSTSGVSPYICVNYTLYGAFCQAAGTISLTQKQSSYKIAYTNSL